jgi:DNA-binding transcriptional ArsR family regulator
MTLFALRSRDAVLAVRFAWSPIWETQAAVQGWADERALANHAPWFRLVGEGAAGLDLTPLLAVLPPQGFVPDFLTPPPRTAQPRLRDQLAEIRATPPSQVGRELALCRETVRDERYPHVFDFLLDNPARARDLLATRLHEAWIELVAPFWVRIQTVLERDIDQRSRMLARHGLRRVLEELHPRILWTQDGISCEDGSGRTVEVDERGLVLMPSACLWPNVATIVDEPWLPTIVYSARGIAELWEEYTAPPDAVARLFGRTRALVLANLDEPVSTTALAAIIGVSRAGTSRHLLALRDTGLVSTTRHGHEVRYIRTELGTAVLSRGRERASSASTPGQVDEY